LNLAGPHIEASGETCGKTVQQFGDVEASIGVKNRAPYVPPSTSGQS
jgi:hypothetical protein